MTRWEHPERGNFVDGKRLSPLSASMESFSRVKVEVFPSSSSSSHSLGAMRPRVPPTRGLFLEGAVVEKPSAPGQSRNFRAASPRSTPKSETLKNNGPKWGCQPSELHSKLLLLSTFPETPVPDDGGLPLQRAISRGVWDASATAASRRSSLG